MLNKKDQRIRRSAQTRKRIAIQRVARLTVHRTPQHMYAQIIDSDGAKVLVSASTLQDTVKEGLKGTGNIAAAAAVGKAIAARAKAAGISTVAFDRGGFRYHGRVKALADAAREGGLVF